MSATDTEQPDLDDLTDVAWDLFDAFGPLISEIDRAFLLDQPPTYSTWLHVLRELEITAMRLAGAMQDVVAAQGKADVV